MGGWESKRVALPWPSVYATLRRSSTVPKGFCAEDREERKEVCVCGPEARRSMDVSDRYNLESFNVPYLGWDVPYFPLASETAQYRTKIG